MADQGVFEFDDKPSWQRMELAAGRLRHRVTIEAPAVPRDQDAQGDEADEWAPVAVVWARVEELGGNRLLAAQQLAAETSHLVTIRFRSGVSPNQRVNYGGRLLNILNVHNPGGKRIALELLCGEWVTP